MSTTPQRIFEDAVRALRQQQAQADRTQQALTDLRVTRHSVDHAVTATLDGRGELVALAFPTDRYRTMPGAALADLIVSTVAEARTEAMRATFELFRPMVPGGVDPADLFAGTVDLPRMLAETVGAVDFLHDVVDPTIATRPEP